MDLVNLQFAKLISNILSQINWFTLLLTAPLLVVAFWPMGLAIMVACGLVSVCVWTLVVGVALAGAFMISFFVAFGLSILLVLESRLVVPLLSILYCGNRLIGMTVILLAWPLAIEDVGVVVC